jgi:hypothetical protein
MNIFFGFVGLLVCGLSGWMLVDGDYISGVICFILGIIIWIWATREYAEEYNNHEKHK